MSKQIDKGLVGFVKRVYLKYFVGYNDPQRYWDKRYSLNLKTDLHQETCEPQAIIAFTNKLADMMQQYDCKNILEVGCGRAKHRSLPGWVGLDFSINVLKKSGLTEFVYADFTKHIPLPDKAFDCVFCQSVLLHVPEVKIEFVVSEMCRVAKRLVIVSEPEVTGNGRNFSFGHSLEELFAKIPFCGDILFLNGDSN